MEESQESNFSLSKYDGTEDGSLSQYMSINDCEREIQMLERDIRQQKESSANAKTSITFDQLRKIHSLSTMLGPHKEQFFERICRVAEIQRASLKNRLKSNINKFEPSTPLSFTQATFDSSQNSLSASESQSFVVTPTTLHNLFNHQLVGKAVFDPNIDFSKEKEKNQRETEEIRRKFKVEDSIRLVFD
ncbi:unnamed protein product [Caenorhabditis nigoni]